MQQLKLAILDLYGGEPNMGMAAIQDIVRIYEDQFEWKVFDVRGKAELPDLSYDIFISTGGPGSPLDGDGHWDRLYFEWLEKVWNWNTKDKETKKHVFFICHSFQMACHHFQIGEVNQRKSRSYGTFPVHKTDTGKKEPFFQTLDNPFYVADFRYWQVVQPDMDRMEELGAELLLLEKFRPHVPLERAMMAVRFSNEIFGTQFHPEAYPKGLLEAFSKEDRKQDIITNHSEEKYVQMMDDIRDPQKVLKTYNTILPTFLEHAIESLTTVLT